MDVYNEEGFDGIINKLLGLDAEMIDKIVDINEGKIPKWKKITLIPSFVKMVNDVWKKIPDVITFLKILNQDIPEVSSTLEELGYISELRQRC
ncbi:hypothetical protein ACFFIS_01395 [Virgibacillus soli]|uniref:Uncharacterized protein n=1 Tax=Paracerasibacillus soli TaxID=480284 RepID=A0ABU5CU98_9BACI|nr:hypothetical protein [Virgibacillus soli]MDY0409409.1 hypothetical protein [Virgibacillus soli]